MNDLTFFSIFTSYPSQFYCMQAIQVHPQLGIEIKSSDCLYVQLQQLHSRNLSQFSLIFMIVFKFFSWGSSDEARQFPYVILISSALSETRKQVRRQVRDIFSLSNIRQLKKCLLLKYIVTIIMHKSFLIPPSINRILGKNRNSVNLTHQAAAINSKNENLSPINNEYTFEPKINSSNGKRRTLQKFIEDQEKFQQQKERKITELKDEISKWQDEQIRLVPQINTSYREKTHTSNHNQSVFDRLSKQRPLKNLITQSESFSPLILPRSKQISRQKTVSDLLYEDAKRRQSKQKIVKLSEEKKLLAMSAPKINKNTNQLVRKKIFNEFMYLINDSSMNPLLALSVIQQIFNVKLRDTSSQTVRRIIELIANEQMEVSTEKLWSFIDLVIGTGHDSVFSKQVQEQIKQKYHFFYQERLKKQKRKKQQEQKLSFRPKTLETSQELAERHRNRQVKKVAEFIEKQKINVNIENETITLEDLFIISQMQRDKENQKKKREKQDQQLAECTFKPHVSPLKSSTKPKQKIVLRQPLKQKIVCQNGRKIENVKNDKKSCSKVNSIQNTQRSHIKMEQKENILKRNRKSMDQLSVRLFMARTERQFQQNMTMRGYPEGENWNQSKRLKHKEIVQNSEKIKGLKNI